MDWDFQTVSLLNKIRLNSIILSNKHRLIGLYYQKISRYFDVPIIILSTFSSSIGSIDYMPEGDKGQINLFISMMITVMTSIKIYLNVATNLNQEIELSREFYILAIDIFKNLNLTKNRPDAHDYLNECYSQYIKLTEKSNLHNKIKKDELLKLDDDDSISSNSSSSSLNIIINDTNEF